MLYRIQNDCLTLEVDDLGAQMMALTAPTGRSICGTATLPSGGIELLISFPMWAALRRTAVPSGVCAIL